MIRLIPDCILYPVVRLLLRLLFRVEVRGLGNYPRTGRRLVIANHSSWLDAALLEAFLPDRKVYAVHTQIARMRWVRPFLRLVTAYTIDPAQPMLLKALCASVERDLPVVIFPEGRLTTTGGLMKVYDGPGFIAHKTGAAIVPVHIDGAHLSAFTRLGSKYRWRLFPRITLTVGPVERIREDMPRDQWTPFIYRMLSEGTFRALNQDHSLYRELIEASRRQRIGRPVIESHDGTGLTYAQAEHYLKRTAAAIAELAAPAFDPSDPGPEILFGPDEGEAA